MLSFLGNLFETSGFPARWRCGNWSAEHGWLHIGSDVAIATAYFTIPVVLGWFVFRRRDIPFPRIFLLFAAFILFCGLTHAIDASIFWHPWYRLSGLMKLLTALVSWATVISLIPMIPKALALPGLAKVNQQLKLEIAERERIEIERLEMQAQFQQTQKLESLGVLAGGIAHDFNNLLTSILGYTDLAKMEIPVNSRAHQYLEEAMNGVRRSAELTNQMLAYSGKGRFVIEPIDLTELIAGINRLLYVSLKKKCTLQFRSPPILPAIDADAAQIRQVVMNLIINASEAIGDREGMITVTTGAMHCDRKYLSQVYLDAQLPEGEYVYLEVADNGCGMTPETLRRIFDPFFTTKFTGRGLGLSAVLGIIRGHRGGVKVYSELGQGTTFKAIFPISAQAARPLPQLDALPEWHGSGLVLVVDDEASIRDLARRMIETMGFRVLVAADGREALDLFRQHPEITLVLLDMTMPVMDGAETFREMRRHRPDIRAILTSGYNEQTATNHFVGKGLAGFIQKPFAFQSLKEIVRHVTES